MRSGQFNFPINRNVNLSVEPFNPSYVYRIAVSPNGTFTVFYWNGKGEDRTSETQEYHLDTDTGFNLFVELVNRSGRADLAAEIRNSIGAALA